MCVVFITLAPFVITYLVIFLGFFVFLATWLVYKSMGEKVRMNHDMQNKKTQGAGWIIVHANPQYSNSALMSFFFPSSHSLAPTATVSRNPSRQFTILYIKTFNSKASTMTGLECY
jgi:hypothetical protein